MAAKGLKCRSCGNEHGDTSGLCLFCRARALGRSRRKYHFTPELLEQMRRAYLGNKRELSAALDRLERATGWPRRALRQEAERRGWAHSEGRARQWTAADIAHLRERGGVVSVRQIARELHRSRQSVEAQAKRLRLSLRVRDGYTIADLAEVFGVHPGRVRRWLNRGLLGRPMAGGAGARVADRAVARFIRNQPDEYDLRRVDQIWFKAMVFGR